MMGTTVSENLPMRSIPPARITPTMTTRLMLIQSVGRPKAECKEPTTALDCTMRPTMPSPEMQRRAKRMAKALDLRP